MTLRSGVPAGRACGQRAPTWTPHQTPIQRCWCAPVPSRTTRHLHDPAQRGVGRGRRYAEPTSPAPAPRSPDLTHADTGSSSQCRRPSSVLAAAELETFLPRRTVGTSARVARPGAQVQREDHSSRTQLGHRGWCARGTGEITGRGEGLGGYLVVQLVSAEEPSSRAGGCHPRWKRGSGGRYRHSAHGWIRPPASARKVARPEAVLPTQSIALVAPDA